MILPFWNKIDQGKDFEDSKNLFKQNPLFKDGIVAQTVCGLSVSPKISWIWSRKLCNAVVKLLRRNLDIFDHLLEVFSICPDIPLEKKQKLKWQRKEEFIKFLVQWLGAITIWPKVIVLRVLDNCVKGVGYLS